MSELINMEPKDYEMVLDNDILTSWHAIGSAEKLSTYTEIARFLVTLYIRVKQVGVTEAESLCLHCYNPLVLYCTTCQRLKGELRVEQQTLLPSQSLPTVADDDFVPSLIAQDEIGRDPVCYGLIEGDVLSIPDAGTVSGVDTVDTVQHGAGGSDNTPVGTDWIPEACSSDMRTRQALAPKGVDFVEKMKSPPITKTVSGKQKSEKEKLEDVSVSLRADQSEVNSTLFQGSEMDSDVNSDDILTTSSALFEHSEMDLDESSYDMLTNIDEIGVIGDLLTSNQLQKEGHNVDDVKGADDAGSCGEDVKLSQELQQQTVIHVYSADLGPGVTDKMSFIKPQERNMRNIQFPIVKESHIGNTATAGNAIQDQSSVISMGAVSESDSQACQPWPNPVKSTAREDKTVDVYDCNGVTCGAKQTGFGSEVISGFSSSLLPHENQANFTVTSEQTSVPTSQRGTRTEAQAGYILVSDKLIASSDLPNEYEWFKCAHCNLAYDHRTAFNDHVRTHFQSSSLCPVVSESDSGETSVESEKGDSTGTSNTGPFVCADCGKSYTLRMSYTAHLRTHRSHTDFFECDLCGVKYLKKKMLARHKQKVHSGDSSLLRCKKCSFQCKYNKHMQYHMKKHWKRAVQCEICGMHLSNMKALQGHLLLHKNEKPHPCPKCERTYRTKEQLNSHLKSHHGDIERPYRCDRCGQGFVKAQNLRDHMYTHTGEKPYQCTMCPSKFVRKDYLDKHVRTHTGVKPYACDKCDRRFSCPRSLKKHRLQHPGFVRKLAPVDNHIIVSSKPSVDCQKFNFLQPRFLMPILPAVATDVHIPENITLANISE